MNLSIIFEFPWFGGWELTATFYADLKQWCWFDCYHTKGNMGDKDSLAEQLGMKSHAKWFESDTSFLCFTLILEGLKS